MNEAGAKHLQKYREEKRAESYVVETLAYEDHENAKLITISFALGKTFEITLTFRLEQIDPRIRNLFMKAKRKGHAEARRFKK